MVKRKVRYFTSAGYTETGGLKVFLQKINPNLEWVCAFPPVKKPAPKLNRPYSTPDTNLEGATGSVLASQMLSHVANPLYNKEYKSDDILLLIDDSDCRFSTKEEFDVWKLDFHKKIREGIGRDIPLIVILASPEVESWFIADWANSFVRCYGKQPAHLIKEELKKIIEGKGGQFEDIENIGQPYLLDLRCCSYKLSSQIELALERISKISEVRITYSKRYDGPSMLINIDPGKVEGVCRTFFAPGYRLLKDIG